MRWIAFFFILFQLSLFGQDTLDYKSLIVRGDGDYLKVKYRSSVTGGKQKLFLKKGEWKYFDETGALVKIEHYKASRSKRKSVREGVEMYLNPFTGDTLLVRSYKKGSIKHQWAYQSYVIKERHQVLHIFKDFESFSVHSYPNLERFPHHQDFVSVWQSTLADPQLIRELDKYPLYEDSMGDARLLEPPAFSTHAQYNYVQNPQFEQHPQAPFSIVSFTDQIPYWIQASESPDFYISPINAHSGTSFLGFRVFTMKKHIEYVQTQLKAPLIKDSTYCFSAYLKLSPSSKFATNAFGVQFTEKAQTIKPDQLFNVQADIILDDQLLNYKTQWMKVQCSYTAKGGERWMTLGSFKQPQDLQLETVPGKAYESYYYLDDVSLVPVKQATACPCNFSRTEAAEDSIPANAELEQLLSLEIGQRLVLDNINFENDRDELLPESFISLNNVLHVLNKMPNLVIELSGHTSSLGSYDHNMDLSERRAKAAKHFLVLNGIAEDRIKTVGYGPQFPVASDDSLAGQLQNRRVEFKVLRL